MISSSAASGRCKREGGVDCTILKRRRVGWNLPPIPLPRNRYSGLPGWSWTNNPRRFPYSTSARGIISRRVGENPCFSYTARARSASRACSAGPWTSERHSFDGVVLAHHPGDDRGVSRSRGNTDRIHGHLPSTETGSECRLRQGLHDRRRRGTKDGAEATARERTNGTSCIFRRRSGGGRDADGEPCWTRTSDPLLKRQMLYRLS